MSRTSGGADARGTPGGIVTAPSGAWINPIFTAAGTVSPPNGEMRLTPIWVPRDITASAIGTVVNVAGTAGALIRLGIYNSTTTGQPKALVLDAGTVAATGTGQLQIAINQALPAGLYFVAVVVQGGPVTSPTLVNIQQYFAVSVIAGSVPQLGGGLTPQGGIVGALPGVPAVAIDDGQLPYACGLKVA